MKPSGLPSRSESVWQAPGRPQSASLGLVIDGPPGFVQGLLADWRSRFRTTVFSHQALRLPVFEERTNRLRLRRALARFLAANDVVFFEWAGPLLVAATRLKTSTPIIVRLHSYDLFAYAPRVNWDAVRRIVLLSRAMQARFCELFPAQASKTCVVHNGVDIARFAFERSRSGGVIGTLGNILPIKRVYELILSVHQLAESGADVELRIAGPEGEGTEGARYFAAVQHLLRALPRAARVSLVGRLDDPAPFLKELDIFVSNSYWEGQQVALLEAMAAGCYCLAHAWDGAEEVLPPDCLFFTDSQLREKVSAFLSLPAAERLRRHASMTAIAAERFRAAHTCDSIRSVIDEALTGTQAGAQLSAG